jgi:hypothetical protein
MWYLRLGSASDITHKRYVHIRDAENQDKKKKSIESYLVRRELPK